MIEWQRTHDVKVPDLVFLGLAPVDRPEIDNLYDTQPRGPLSAPLAVGADTVHHSPGKIRPPTALTIGADYQNFCPVPD